MAGFGGFNEKKKKKKGKQDSKTGSMSMSVSSRPEYTMPEVIKKEKKYE